MKYILILFLFSTSLISQETRTGTISGRVVDATNQAGLIGVTVRVMNTNKGAITKLDGKFLIKDVPVGEYALKFSYLGYKDFIVSEIIVNSGRPQTVEVELSPASVELEGVEVTASPFVKLTESVTSTQSLSFEDLRRAPGGNEDVIKVTSLLPGVSTPSFRNDLIVRGGAPFENLFLIDGVQIQNINHFGSQGSTGGPISLINIDFVKNVEFSAGGFGANYGDRLSSITNIKFRNGNEERFTGKVNLSAIGFGANLEGPMGENGSWFFSARRSYLDLLFNYIGLGFVPTYWDFTTKLNHRIDEKNTISFINLTVLDEVNLNNEDPDLRLDNSRIPVPNQENAYSAVTWQHIFKKGFVNTTAGFIYREFNTFQNDSNLVRIFENVSKEPEAFIQTEFDFQLDPFNRITFGAQSKFGMGINYEVLVPGQYRTDSNRNPVPLNIDTTFNTLYNSLFFNYDGLFGSTKLIVGARIDNFNYTDDPIFFSPRLSLIQPIIGDVSLLFSMGRYYQSPSYIWLIGGTDGLNPAIADQAVLGFEYLGVENWKFQVEAYYKSYSNYFSRDWRPQAVFAPAGFQNLLDDIPFGLEPLSNNGQGQTYGIEIFAQKKLSQIPLYGIFSLSISKNTFTADDGIERDGTFDSRVVLNLAAGYKFNSKWEMSAKYRYLTGSPYTPFNDFGQIDFDRFNFERFPDFYTLDVRLDRRWNTDNLAFVFYIDIQNIINRQNIQNVRWDYRNQEQILDAGIGVLPSIGASIEF